MANAPNQPRNYPQADEGVMTVTIPRESNGTSIFSTLRADFLPSVVVFLVALPLCMGISIASGVPVAAGLITGIVGGLVTGMLAGAPLQVSGPAAGLTVIVYGIVQQYGLEGLGAIVLLAGLMQLAAGVLRLGQWFRAVSPAVIKGMLAGIGVLILGSQFHVMMDDKPKENGIQNLLTIPQAIAKGSPWPEPATAEQRRRRTEYLKQVGTLHERQTQLSERVSELVPPDGESAVAVDDALLEPLIAAQEALTSDVKSMAEKVQANHLAKTNTGTSASAAAEAAEQSEAALAALRDGDVAALQASQSAASESLEQLADSLKSHAWAAKVGLATIVLLVLWQAFAKGRLRTIPAPLVAVVVVTGAAAVWSLPVLYVEVPDNLLSAVRVPSPDLFYELPLLPMLGAALFLALVASAETLLCATAVDQMHQGSRTQYDRELIAQGVGNTICGLLGALPMTGVIVRSAANVQAGATSRASAILHGLWLLIFVALLGTVLRAIPVASLAAVLVYTGYKLVNPKGIRELAKYGWGEVVIFFATLIGIVATDLLTGVLLGIALSAVKLLLTFSHLDVTLRPESGQPDRVVLSLNGAATFLRLPRLAAALEKVPPYAELHVDFEHLDYIDHACLDLLMNWAKQHEAAGGRLVIDWDSLHANFRKESPKLRTSVA